jgi:hypothetical protein
VAIAIFSLIDIQWKKQLYFSVVAFDLTTRTAIVDAITRTGVPPINPSYFPGHPVPLTFIYYFWYIPCSLIDQLGGRWIDARMAMIASITWCGLALMSVIALYLRLRTGGNAGTIRKSALLGIGLLLVSGLDVIPAAIYMIGTRLSIGAMWPAGDIEHWNTIISAWAGSLLWVPQHVASLIACITALLLMQSSRGKQLSHQITIMVITGLSLASAAGLSLLITFVFGIFWGSWLVMIIVKEKDYKLTGRMALSGLIALAAAAPFLMGLLHSGGSASGSPLISFEVRVFDPLTLFIDNVSPLVQNAANLLFLPLNYILELGFFFMIGILWWQRAKNRVWVENPYASLEIIMMTVVLIIGSFLNTSLTGNNDLGWRCWLFGQFVLIIWAVDLAEPYLSGAETFRLSGNMGNAKTRRNVTTLAIIGIITTVFDLGMLRAFSMLVDADIAGFPNRLSPDTQLGSRTYAARAAYDFIRDNTPPELVVQHNPLTRVDRPAGLYGSRQMAISDHAAYGVSEQDFEARMNSVGNIFEMANAVNWKTVDQLCDAYAINILVIKDIDPLWLSLPALAPLRAPLYQNDYYAVFECGHLANR